MEHLLYNNRFNEQDLQIRQRAKFARRPKEKGDEWNPDSVTDDQLDEWIKKRCSVKHTKKLLDARYIQHYLPETDSYFKSWEVIILSSKALGAPVPRPSKNYVRSVYEE